MPSREPQIVALIGLRGSGKTTLGRLLARELGRPFVDLDAEILRAAHARGIAGGAKSAGEWLATAGLSAFRALEGEVLQELLERTDGPVLATGGGAVERAVNRALLAAHAHCVWLRCAPEILAARVEADPELRPALAAGGALVEAQELLARREPWYRELARLELDTGPLTAREAAARLLTGLRRSP